MAQGSMFPSGFQWGAATSAYQIEGSPLADGAGESNWHRFSHSPGKIDFGHHGDVACDHYRRAGEDVGLMRELGLQAYRFSISWSRVIPEGTGRVNQPGLDFYARLVDSLLEHGIAPSVTLHHWDLPAKLEDLGGWTHRDSAGWFADYAHLMFRTLGDRVPQWTTINEPWVIVDQGYVAGNHAPGRRDLAAAAAASLNLLHAHALAVDVYRSKWRRQIGLVVNLAPIHAASESTADQQAADRFDAYLNRQFLDPVLLGQVPSQLSEVYGPAWPEMNGHDLAAICRPLDFLGINYYLRWVVRDDPAAGPLRASIVEPRGAAATATGWEVYPRGLVEVLTWVRNRYGALPLYVTENGAAFDDQVGANGAVDDPQRIEYLRRHLMAARQAIDGGINLKGYFVWSLLDNFEWAYGYAKRFGIVHVDYETQRRTPKSSARFYSQVIRSNGAVLGGECHDHN